MLTVPITINFSIPSTAAEWDISANLADSGPAARELSEALKTQIQAVAEGRTSAEAALDAWKAIAQKYGNLGALDSEPVYLAKITLLKVKECRGLGHEHP